MEALVFADAHVHPFAPFASVDGQGRNSRAQEIVQAVEIVYQYAIDNEVPTVFFLGDMWHVRGKVYTYLFNQIFDTIKSAADDYGVQTFMLAGNHDYVVGQERETGLHAFGEIKNVTVVEDRPLLNLSGDGDVLFHLCPWGTLGDISARAAGGATQILMGHEMIEGAKVGPTNRVMEGVEHDLTRHCWDLVLLGDVHKRQEVRKGVYYVGGLVGHNFGDANEPRGFLRLSVVNKQINFTWIDLDTPRFVVLQYPGEAWCKEAIANIVEGAYVRVDLRDGPEDQIREELVSAGAKSVVFNHLVDNSAQSGVVPEKVVISDTTTLMAQYVEMKNRNTESGLLDMGKEFVQAVEGSLKC